MIRPLFWLTGIFWAVLLVGLGGCSQKSQTDPLVSRAEPAPASQCALPIDEIEDKHPGSLRGWHLYQDNNARATVGDAISFIGQYQPESNRILFQQPPWITVAFASDKAKAGERPDTFQAFVVHPQPSPVGLEANGYARFKGVLKVNQPHLSTNYKDDRNIPVFQVNLTEANAIRLAQPVDKLQQSCPAIVRQAEPRLREWCARNHLKYNFDASNLSMSWYHGRIAFTAPVTTYPRFSFTPVPYATLSVLFDPETGNPTGLIIQRRIWQDPHD